MEMVVHARFQSVVCSLVQVELRCCGLEGPADYPSRPHGLPASCCAELRIAVTGPEACR
jgi:hypothetical protein